MIMCDDNMIHTKCNYKEESMEKDKSLTPRQIVEKEIAKALMEFNRTTGVSVRTIAVEWLRERETGDLARTNYLTSISMEMNS